MMIDKQLMDDFQQCPSIAPFFGFIGVAASCILASTFCFIDILLSSIVVFVWNVLVLYFIYCLMTLVLIFQKTK
jgi:hypothetical protein